MNTNLDIYRIAEAIVMLLEQFGIVVDNASVDLVPYLKTLGDKIVAYKSSVAWMFVWVGIGIATVAIILFIIGSIQDWDGIHIFILAVGLLAAAIVIVTNMHTVITCNTFPEKVILDYINDVMSSNTGSR